MLCRARAILQMGEAPVPVKKKIGSDGDGGESGGRGGKVQETMYAFSAGCVTAEVFLEDVHLRALSQLLKYREGELSVKGTLGTIEDEVLGWVSILLRAYLVVNSYRVIRQ